MKIISKSLLVIIAILFNIQLFAQTDAVAVVSADKMNVFYIGLDNPISIAVPGVPSDKLRVTIKNGSLTGSNGKYTVKVDNPAEVIIHVAAEIKPGVEKDFGESIFRVKRVPDPVACIGKYCSTEFTISKEELLQTPGLTIMLNLPFELKFEIVSFTLTYYSDKNLYSESTTGNKFSAKMIEAIKGMKSSGKFWIEDIKAKGPDGNTRNLGSMKITLIEVE